MPVVLGYSILSQNGDEYHNQFAFLSPDFRVLPQLVGGKKKVAGSIDSCWATLVGDWGGGTGRAGWGLERGTRFELATNSVEGCDSTIELPPLCGDTL